MPRGQRTGRACRRAFRWARPGSQPRRYLFLFWRGGGPFFAVWPVGFPRRCAAAPAFFAAALFFAAPESGLFVPAERFAWDDGLGLGGESQGLPGVADGFFGGDGARVRSGGAEGEESAGRDGMAGGAPWRSHAKNR